MEEKQEDESIRRYHLTISGRVQGVFFRANVQKKAEELGLAGWVRNMDDGRVEAVAQGPEDKVRELAEFCRKGPMLAKVDDVDVEEEKPEEGLSGFEIRY
ncbi:MAG: acylphosphatase [Candidatus Woesearchaeota archaeon]